MFDQRRAIVIALGILLFLSIPLSGQQAYVSRYDFYTGYAFLDSTKIGLFENGFHTQFGYRAKTWVSLGFDYSVTAGDMTLTPGLLPVALQQELGAQLGYLASVGALPPGYALRVPAHAVTNSFAIGPQLAYRHFSKATFFIRPSIGAIREGATPQPADPIAAAIASQLVPTGYKRDWQGFYGVGAGFDILFTRRLALRTQADYVYDHLFNDLLRDGRWTTRFSFGPCFNFGRNIRGE
jgi:hypothetical protein